MKVQIDDFAFMPEYAHDTDAGMDIKSPIDFNLLAHSYRTIDSGVHVELPPNTCGVLISKSGLNVNHEITSTGLIDESYCGSIKVKLYNNGNKNHMIHCGDKISQLVVVPYMHVEIEKVDKLEEKGRGNSGLGSTGR